MPLPKGEETVSMFIIQCIASPGPAWATFSMSPSSGIEDWDDAILQVFLLRHRQFFPASPYLLLLPVL